MCLLHYIAFLVENDTSWKTIKKHLYIQANMLLMFFFPLPFFVAILSSEISFYMICFHETIILKRQKKLTTILKFNENVYSSSNLRKMLTNG